MYNRIEPDAPQGAALVQPQRLNPEQLWRVWT